MEAAARVDQLDGARRALEPHEAFGSRGLEHVVLGDAVAVVEVIADPVGDELGRGGIYRRHRAHLTDDVVEVDHDLDLARIGLVQMPQLGARRRLPRPLDRVPEIDLGEDRDEAEIGGGGVDDVAAEGKPHERRRHRQLGLRDQVERHESALLSLDREGGVPDRVDQRIAGGDDLVGSLDLAGQVDREARVPGNREARDRRTLLGQAVPRLVTRTCGLAALLRNACRARHGPGGFLLMLGAGADILDRSV